MSHQTGSCGYAGGSLSQVEGPGLPPARGLWRCKMCSPWAASHPCCWCPWTELLPGEAAAAPHILGNSR